MSATIHHGDCLDVMRKMPDNSVDAVVCDPPYGLSNTSPDKVTETIVRWAQGDREYVPQGKGFMGASWDAFVPPVAVWDECLRVLKPGGHLVAFAGSRTQDLMGIAIRLAGFDVRENLAYLYGSGFPKSLDVSKAIDKIRDDGAEVEAVRTFLDTHRVRAGITKRAVAEHFDVDSRMVMKWMGDKPDKLRHCPTWEQWLRLKEFLDLPADMDAEVARLNGRKGTPGEAWGLREVVGTSDNGIAGGTGRHTGMEGAYGFGAEFDITKAHTPEAEKWSGWGTALKPAHEPIILARKPLSESTVAANVLTWGTGGINIDKTRITAGSDYHDLNVPHPSGIGGVYDATDSGRSGEAFKPAAGRWPANVVLDSHQAAALDQQADETSRFFKVAEPDPPFMYAAKAPKKERPSYVNEEGKTIQHATVKPLSICRWLVKLVTPEGGTVLDPFAGSGTTVEAALLEGFNVIGIEREAEYLPLIQQRINRATPTDPEPTETDLLDLITGGAA